MADNLIFPIGFDLESGVQKVMQESDAVLRRLQKTIDGKPLTIPVNIDKTKFDTYAASLNGSLKSLTENALSMVETNTAKVEAGALTSIDKIKEAMQALSKEWNAMPQNEKFDGDGKLSAVAQNIIKQYNELAVAAQTHGQTLEQIASKIRRTAEEEAKANDKKRASWVKLRQTMSAQENSIANITAKLKVYKQALNSQDVGSKKFEQTARKIQELTAKLEQAQRKVKELTSTSVTGADKQVNASRRVTASYEKQYSYLDRLIRRMAVYWSVGQVANFITRVREVTAQFELQRVSLGAIIQDQARANQLFAEIKSFALTSPVKILDLTKYTKQLAAYKIGWDGVKTDTKELFDTMKRLTDVSVGLGVSMDRIVLLYGQIRATGYLRACLGKGTLVKMFNEEYRKVEDIDVGDVLMGDDEKPRKVSQLFRGKQQMYVVKYGNNKQFRCNEHHVLTLYNCTTNTIEDVYVFNYINHPKDFKGVKRVNGQYEYFDIDIFKDIEDDYFGFAIDGNKRFIITKDDIVTHNSEVRQATEAGIPLVEELANKLTAMNGQLVTAADVMDMISKRGISFELVKQVFEDMTSAGGIFYNMQEKQGDTLYGMWAKLGDAASVMYEEIGNTDGVSKGLKGAIQLATDLMRNWENVAKAVMSAGIAISAVKLGKNVVKRGEVAITSQAAQATQKRVQAQERLNIALATGSAKDKQAAREALKKASADEQAAIKAQGRMSLTSKIGQGLTSLGKSLATGAIWGVAIAGFTALLTAIIGVESKAEKLQRKLALISQETSTQIYNSTKRFIQLAEQVVGEKVVDGSKAQKDALEELQRTYGSMIPQEELSVENLRRLRNGAEDAATAYKSLTDALESYIVQRQKEKALETIEETYGADIKSYKGNLKDNFIEAGSDVEAYGRFMTSLDIILAEGTEKVAERYGYLADYLAAKTDTAKQTVLSKIKDAALKDALEQALGDDVEMIDKLFNSIYADSGAFRSESWITKIVKDSLEAADEIKGVENKYNGLNKSQQEYLDILKEISEYNNNLNFSVVNAAGGDQDFAQQQMRINLNIQKIADTIKNNKKIKDAFTQAGVEIKDEWFNVVTKLNNGMAESTIDFASIFASLKDKSAPELKNFLLDLQKMYVGFVPKNETVRQLKQAMFDITKTIDGLNMKNMQMYLWDGSKAIDKHLKDTKDQIKELKQRIAETAQAMTVQLATQGMIGASLTGQMDDLKKTLDALEQYEKIVQMYVLPEEDKDRGRKSDPRLGILQEMASTLKNVNKEYEQLAQKEGSIAAFTDATNKYADTFKYLQTLAEKYGFALPSFGVPKDASSLKKYLEAIKAEMAKLKNSDKAVLQIGTDIADIDMNEVQKKIDKQLKELADKISRTKTAQEFYNKILNTTGDMRLAEKISLSIYDSTGDELQEQMAQQLKKYFKNEKVNIDIPDYVMDINGKINYTALDQFADTVKEKLGEEPYKAVKKFAQEGQKELAKVYEGYLKDLEKAKTYSDKRIELARYTMTKISEIENSDLPQAEKERLKAGYEQRQTRMQGQIEWEAFKDMPMYVQMFDDLDNTSSYMLTNMKAKLGELKSVWGAALNPTQLKELQSRMNDIDAQIAKRNPFKSLSNYIKQYIELRKKGTQADAEQKLVAATKKHADAVAKLNLELDIQKKLQEKYDRAVALHGKNSTEAGQAKNDFLGAADSVDQAQKLVDKTEQEVALAQELVDLWAQITGGIKGSTSQVLGIISSIGDIASGIGKSVEALGGDEEDAQYWNDIASGVNEVTGAVTDFTTAIMSQDPAAIISSSINLIPSLISGFSSIFSAGKIRKANKEIKKQQELLDHLEYTYQHLQNASDKLFGADYINNYNKQIDNLQAQAEAYRKQYQAEQSKGKKADKDKLKEYEQAYRDTMDEIADMQGQIAAQMLGSDITSAARDFANAWLDAYKEFSNTSDAMSEKFKEMINNMVVESLLAKVMERALEPAFKMIDGMSSQDFYSQSFWERVISTAEQGAKNADKGAQAMMKFLEQAGISMRDVNSEYTGIQRDIAGASEETMSSVAAIGNTLMYYVSAIPSIDSNVAIIRQIIEQSSAQTGASANIDTTALWNRHLELQQGIYEHTRQSAERCEAMAAKCTQIADDIHRVIVPRGGGSATASIQVRM